jgi:hypothetical protein
VRHHPCGQPASVEREKALGAHRLHEAIERGLVEQPAGQRAFCDADEASSPELTVRPSLAGS